MEFSSVINDILKGKEAEKQKPTAYDTTAEVLRIDGDTAWVHMAGGIDETPVKLTIDAKPGDTVQVRVGGGRAWLTGNLTAPPTDDTSALEAKILAKVADEQAKTVVKRADDGEFDGEDGFSPEATVTKVGDTTTITITDKDGTTTEEIKDGDKIETFVESGSVATFEAVEYPALELVADIEPIQPNDYDSVWVGGAGKNKLAPWVTSTTNNNVVWTANSDGTLTSSGTASPNSSQILSGNITLPNGTYILSGCPSGGSGSTYYLRVLLYNSSNTLVSHYSDYGSEATFAIDASIAYIKVFVSVNSGNAAPSGTWKPMIRLATETDATYKPYENICPIYGHDHCDVTRVGKNLITMDSSASASYSSNGITWTKIDGNTIHVQGTATAQSNCALTSDWGKLFHAVLPAGTYRATTDSDVRLRVGIGPNNTNKGNAYGGFSFTITESTDVWLGLFVSNGANINKDVTVQLEQGSTATTFEAYKGIEYTTDFPQTVYGGTLDVVNGVLTVDRAIVTYNGTESWSSSNSGMRLERPLTGVKVPPNISTTVGLVCNEFSETTAGGTWDGTIGVAIDTRGYISVCKTGQKDMTQATFQAFLSSNPMQVVYPLATSQTYNLSPKDIKLLNGTNNVWANTGDVEIKYAIITEATLETLGNARKMATKYITDMGDDGIIVHPENDTSNYSKINAEGMDVVKGGNSVAYYGDNSRIGKESGAKTLISEVGIDLITEDGALAFSVESGTVTRTIQFVSTFSETYTPTTTDQSITFDELDDAVSDTNVYIGFNIDNGDGTGSYYSRTFTKDGTSQNWTQNHISGEYDGVKTFQYRKDNTYPNLTISNIKLRYYKNVLVPNNQFYGDIIIDDNILHNADWYTEAKTVLWTNPNPGDNFSAQTVSLYNSSTGISAYDCDEVEIYYINTASDARWSSVKVPVDKVWDTNETILAQGASAQNRVYSRRATLTVSKLGANTMEFKQGYYQTTAGAGYCIPQQIIGIKHI